MSIEPRIEGDVDLGRVEFNRTGLVIASDIRFEQWVALGSFLETVEGAIQWWLGDWLNYGEWRWGETYAQAVDDTGLERQTLMNAKWVAGHVETSRRRENLPWSYHAEVASLEPPQQDAWLDRVEEESWTRAQLRQEMQRAAYEQRLLEQAPSAVEPDAAIVHGDCREVLAFDACVDLIVADPPFGVSRDGQAGVRQGKGEWDELTYPELHAFNEAWLARAVAALHDGGSMFVFGCGHSMPSVGHVLQGLGCYIIRDIVWAKPFVQPAVNLDQLVPSHELILWARKGARHKCNLFEVTRDVWEVQPSAPFHHPDEKPEALIARLVEMASDPGDLVADPFLGSGTTTAVARRLRRRYWGAEIDEYWWKVATERTRQAGPQGG